MIPRICKDHDRPGCLTVPDDRFTMNFDDIGMPPILWGAHFKAAIEKRVGMKIPLDTPSEEK